MWFPLGVHLLPLTQAQAEDIASWHYEGEFSAYDLDGSFSMPFLADYLGAWEEVDGISTLIGYVVFGEDARVPGLEARPNVVDIGIGLRPGLLGRGLGVALANLAIEHAAEVLGAHHLRACVQSWNLRSQALCFRMGFHVAGQHGHARADGQYLQYEIFMRSL